MTPDNPIAAFRRRRRDGFNVLFHSQTGTGWSYLVRTGAVLADLPPIRLDTAPAPRAPLFRSGWIVIATYDHGLGFERIPLPNAVETVLPPILSLRADEIIALPPTDTATMPRTMIVGQGSRPDKIPRFARNDKTDGITRPERDDGHPERSEGSYQSNNDAHEDDAFTLGPWTTRTSDADYERLVARAKEYIAAGDIYQVNLARWFEAPFHGDPFALFARLARRNPSPYACYLDLSFLETPTVIVSSSPELLFRIEGRRIVTRPIAGTYARDRDPATLPRDPKERAEHIMLVDLERNDLGRIARPGTVIVEELLGVETYSHLHHIVSQVAAELRSGVTLDEVFRAVFPGGTITGAPKIRAMEIISELEGVRRGLYTGAIGFVDEAGAVAMNIVIRTAVIQSGRVHLATGAGIVADSVPAREAAETRIKAAAFGVR